MQRRSFIKKAATATAGAFALPYILPSGRLFAASGVPLAEHVILIMFAGGVRQQESVLQRYLDDSQGMPIPGNIMYNLFNGQAPAAKIVYGTDGLLAGDTPIPSILNQTLQSQGTLFSELRTGTTGHYNGLNALVQGNTLYTQGLKQKPIHPTIFEYARRHGGYAASKVWFVGNGIGNSTPLLNYSTHPDYGAAFGANFLAPTIVFGNEGETYMSKSKVYHPEEELGPMYEMKYFLDNNFKNAAGTLEGIHNTEDEKQSIKEFFKEMYQKSLDGTVAFPPVNDNGDLKTVGYACEVAKWFKPNLLAINMSAVDGCHSDFTGYLKALHRADHAVAHIWNYIQTQVPEMAGNTAIILAPECGRNLNHNPIKDENDWYAFDHSDQNSLRVFGMMAGPSIPSNLTVGSNVQPVGNTVDVVPTIAEILGFKNEVVSSGLLASDSLSWFERM